MAVGRLRIVATGALLAIVAGALVIVSVPGEGGDARAAGPGSTPSRPLPPRWHEVRRPLSGVLLPVQVFAAATYPIMLEHRPRTCGPWAAVAQLPARGVLLDILEYPSHASGRPIRVPRLPRRPARFSYADATWSDFECAGPSYKFGYRQDGRALQAQVWMHRGTVAPRLRAEALRILDDYR